MTLDELKLQVSQDLRVDDEHLDTESLKNQELKIDQNTFRTPREGTP